MRQPTQVEYQPNPIQCVLEGHNASSEAGEDVQPSPALVFTHGAKGTLNSDAMANFSLGFSTKSPILCFQGNMNLKSRVKMFDAVLEHHKFYSSIGGRSMGARAAIMATTEKSSHLILVSYPLHTAKEVRDQVLLDLPQSMKVLFMIGENDSMCNLERLENIRGEMKCKSWRTVVKNADHGMNVKPKVATMEVGKLCGSIAAIWLSNCDDEERREGVISWDDETKEAKWSGWTSENATPAAKRYGQTAKGKRNGNSSMEDGEIDPDNESISKRTRKRVKA